MAKYIVRPNQRVTHGSLADANAHFAKMPPGTPLAGYPAAPLTDYYEGDEIDLTEDEAAQMPHAVCTPDEFDEISSPSALIKKGYTRDEAESMAVSLREGMAARAKDRKTKARRQVIPGGGMAPLDGSTEIDPRAAGKFPESKAEADAKKSSK